MINFDYNIIIWDFDGVILNSMTIRDLGFVKVLESYPKNQVDELMLYHRDNGGLSRYVKFRYFFEKIRNEQVDEYLIADLANKFSNIMLSLLIDEKLLIKDSLSFIQKNYSHYIMHIASGSDQNELRYICEELGIGQYFKTITGSPTPKCELVRKILNDENNRNAVLIGDSRNDYEAAKENEIDFIGYNNTSLAHLGTYINSFSDE